MTSGYGPAFPLGGTALMTSGGSDEGTGRSGADNNRFSPSNSPVLEQLAFQASREVRHTLIHVVTAHLKGGAAVSWQGLNFDFTSVVFDGGDFYDAKFSGGEVDFGRAEFSGGLVFFQHARFSGGTVDFGYAKFSSGTVDFGTVGFGGAEFSGGTVDFSEAGDWSTRAFPWTDTPPQGVRLPSSDGRANSPSA
jgi:hypothetical protein